MPRKVDLHGKKVGMLLVIKETSERKNGGIAWECLCDCGNKTLVASSDLVRERTKNCGCIKSYEDFTGKRFDKLFVIERSKEVTKDKHRLWKCKCDCGNIVFVRANDLKTGNQISCGCMRSVDVRKRFEKDLRPLFVEDTYIHALTSKVGKRNTSGVKGVSLNKKQNKWTASICIKGKTIYLGSFVDKEEAIKARLLAEEEYFAPLINKYKK